MDYKQRLLPVLAAYCRLPLFLKGDVGFCLPAGSLEDILPCIGIEEDEELANRHSGLLGVRGMDAERNRDRDRSLQGILVQQREL